MKDYFIIIANSDLKNYSELKNYIESIGKTIFIPSVDIDSNDIYGIKVLEGLKESKEVIVVQTPSLGDDEKAMDQVFLAYSIKPDNILVWEPEPFKLSHELRSYLKKAPKANSLYELLGITDESVIVSENQYKINQNTNVNQEETSSEVNNNFDDSAPVVHPADNDIICGETHINSSIESTINANTQKGEIADLPPEIPVQNSNTDISEKISHIDFKLDENSNVIVSVTWTGRKNKTYSVRLFRKKVKKSNFRGYTEIVSYGSENGQTSEFIISNADLYLDHNKNNKYNILVELKKKQPNNVFELVDSKDDLLIIYHYFNFFSKSQTRIVR